MGKLGPLFRQIRNAAETIGQKSDLLPGLPRQHRARLSDMRRQVQNQDRYEGRPDADGAAPRGWLRDRRLRRGQKTGPGWHFLPDGDRAAAGDVPTYPGEYTLDLHGAPHAVQGGDGSMLSASEFAEHVRKHTDWDGTSPIRLFSCDTGRQPDGFGQQLADALGVPVTAPTRPVWSRPGGPPFITDMDPITGAPVWPPNGTWVGFQPTPKTP